MVLISFLITIFEVRFSVPAGAYVFERWSNF